MDKVQDAIDYNNHMRELRSNQGLGDRYSIIREVRFYIIDKDDSGTRYHATYDEEINMYIDQKQTNEKPKS